MVGLDLVEPGQQRARVQVGAQHGHRVQVAGSGGAGERVRGVRGVGSIRGPGSRSSIRAGRQRHRVGRHERRERPQGRAGQGVERERGRRQGVGDASRHLARADSAAGSGSDLGSDVGTDSGQVAAERDDGGAALAATHPHGDVSEVHPDGRLRLVHGHGGRLDELVPQAVPGDEVREALDEVDPGAGDAGDDVGGHVGVARRVHEGVAGSGPAQVGFEVDVDDERLRLDLLVGQHAVPPTRAHPAQLDDVAAGHARSPEV